MAQTPIQGFAPLEPPHSRLALTVLLTASGCLPVQVPSHFPVGCCHPHPSGVVTPSSQGAWATPGDRFKHSKGSPLAIVTLTANQLQLPDGCVGAQMISHTVDVSHAAFPTPRCCLLALQDRVSSLSDQHCHHWDPFAFRAFPTPPNSVVDPQSEHVS